MSTSESAALADEQSSQDVDTDADAPPPRKRDRRTSLDFTPARKTARKSTQKKLSGMCKGAHSARQPIPRDSTSLPTCATSSRGPSGSRSGAVRGGSALVEFSEITPGIDQKRVAPLSASVNQCGGSGMSQSVGMSQQVCGRLVEVADLEDDATSPVKSGGCRRSRKRGNVLLRFLARTSRRFSVGEGKVVKTSSCGKVDDEEEGKNECQESAESEECCSSMLRTTYTPHPYPTALDWEE